MTRRGRRGLAAAGVMAVVLLSGCTGASHELDGSWTLVSLVDAQGTAPAAPRGRPITLELHGTSLSGSDSCNALNATVSSTDPWRMSGLASTAMGCLDGLDAARGRFDDALTATRSARLDGVTLVLVGPGATRLRFERAGSGS